MAHGAAPLPGRSVAFTRSSKNCAGSEGFGSRRAKALMGLDGLHGAGGALHHSLLDLDAAAAQDVRNSDRWPRRSAERAFVVRADQTPATSAETMAANLRFARSDMTRV